MKVISYLLNRMMDFRDMWGDIAVQLIMPGLVGDLGSIKGIEAKLVSGGDKVVVMIPLSNSVPAELRVDGASREGVLRKPSPYSTFDRRTLEEVDRVIRDYGFVAYQGDFTRHPFSQEDLWRKYV